MPRPILSVPTPCHESWAAMTPAAQGRHCAACEKVVVDFTRMSDAELVAFLGRQTGSTCGRFQATQLERPLLPAATTPRWPRLVAAVLALAGVGVAAAPAAAQVRPPAPVEQHHSITLGMVAAAPAPQLALPPEVVRGVVLDSATQAPLPGVTILVRGTTLGVSSGVDGQFALPLPAAVSRTGPLELQIIFTGYVSQLVKLRSAASSQPLTVVLAPDGQMLSGEVVVTGGYCASRWYSPRGLWNRFTRPFRR